MEDSERDRHDLYDLYSRRSKHSIGSIPLRHRASDVAGLPSRSLPRTGQEQGFPINSPLRAGAGVRAITNLGRDERDWLNEVATSRGEARVMPQDMVSSPYDPKEILQKIRHESNKGHRLLAGNSAFVLCDWFLSVSLQRNRP